MNYKRILCLDLGDTRIGLAVSDLLGITAQGCGVLISNGEEKDIENIRKLAIEKDAGLIVVGFPINMDGTKGAKAQKIESFFLKMKDEMPCECVLWDERLTTKQAERFIEEAGYNWKKKREIIDEMAAQLILQSYLDCNI